MAHNQRKHFFINKNLQTRYIVYIVGTLLVVSLVSAVSVYFSIWNSVVENFSNETIKNRMELSTRLREYSSARTQDIKKGDMTLALFEEIDLYAAREREILNETLANTYKDLAPLVLLLFFFIGWGSIFITHQVAGPLFRINLSLEELARGKVDFRFHLRKHDHGKFVIPSFNKVLERLDRDFSKLKKKVKEKSLDDIEKILNTYKTTDESK